jgi:RNA polymerase sigma-70 factor, ECF subfamily
MQGINMETKNLLLSQWPTLQPRVEGYVRTLVKNADDAADIMQEVFIKAYTRIGTLKDAEKLQQWLFSIARNEANAHLNKRNKTPLHTLPETEEEPMPLTADFENCIDVFINQLPKKYSQAVYMAEIKAMPQNAIAQQLNISYSGAKSRVQRGRTKLKELLTECCNINHDRYGNIIDYQPKPGGYCAQHCG